MKTIVNALVAFSGNKTNYPVTVELEGIVNPDDARKQVKELLEQQGAKDFVLHQHVTAQYTML